ncbi:MAG TPA: DUF6600 domain-containing protein [Alphaproteobacteria bacterium]|nr:DUF6600 domain-containing protein [Alphaproteobacteria bacterium]
MKTKATRWLVVLWTAMICLASVAIAQTAGVEAQYGSGPSDPAEETESNPATPQPGVARISLIHGDVSMQRGDTGDWATVTLNTPLVRGDQIATGAKSHAELQLDYANIVRLSSDSQIKIADLTRTRIQVQVAQGYVNYSAFKGSEADAEVDTPNVAVRLLRNGRYRIQVNSEMETQVIVRNGEAEITTPQGSTVVKEGQEATIRGTDNPEYRVDRAPDKDDWDRFNKDRDDLIQRAEGYRRTNAYYTGANDLDAYGRWVYVPGYGDVWSPYNHPVGWAPYQTGRWVWEPYYGWTWVSYEPWGWAPYHYGRWFLYADAWYWWPGPVHRYYRPVWAPAYVFFIGFGHRSNVAFGFGNIGWLPCGPADPYYRWYGRGYNRVSVTNITNINIRNVTINRGTVAPLWADRRVRGFSNMDGAVTNPRLRASITNVSAEDFGRGGAGERRHGVDATALREGQVMTANVPVVPTRESLRATEGGARGTPDNIRVKNNDHFFTRNQPPAAAPAFKDQAAQMQRVVQGGGNPDRLPNLRNPGRDNQPVGGGQTAIKPDGVPTMRNPGRDDHPAGGVQTGGNGSVNNSMKPPTMRTGGGEAVGGVAQKPPTSGSQGSAGGSSDGWRRFGGGRQTEPGNGASGNRQETAPRTEVVPQNDHANNGSPAVQGGATSNGRNGVDWQRFPSANRNNSPANGGGSSPSPDRGNRSYGKPELPMDKPIVTQRTHENNSGPSYTPPSRGSDNRSYSPPSRGSDNRSYSPPSRGSDNRSYSPPSRGSSAPSHSSESHSSGGSSHGSSGGGHDKSSDSKPHSR